MINQGPNPPPVLRLSDGGHIENLGILPLLKLKLKKIVAVNGGRTISDDGYGETLLAGLDMARKKLGCSFSAMNGRDIAEDIRDNFVEKPPGSQPSSYRLVICTKLIPCFPGTPKFRTITRNSGPWVVGGGVGCRKPALGKLTSKLLCLIQAK